MFGKYRILSVLGSGSFSTVYLAEHLKLKVYRAIKSIPKGKVRQSSLSLKDGFPTEAHLLKNLNHPGIPLIYDIDEDTDFIYIIEEFIQGESLDTFVLHQNDISQELIIKFGIQLCDILNYLHHFAPYPILYQDFKPEHIILCGNQLKLIDFGIASFFTVSGNNFQIYGTDGFVAPEVLNGLPATPGSDIYGLGKVLEFLSSYASPKCSSRFLRLIRHTTAKHPEERIPTAANLKTALIHQQTVCRKPSHLIRNIAVLGCRKGVGATHFAVSLVSILNKKRIPALYMPAEKMDTLSAMAESNSYIKEQEGIFSYGYFHGIPPYGMGVEPISTHEYCLVKDYGFYSEELSTLMVYDFVFVILSGSDWDMQTALALGKRASLLEQTIF
ncbi:MAG: serine/threonine-protein kinase, partial [Clostridiales bacterium]|nr:serine/threonine-protein kinase [Clostridiales bacterium]